MLLNTRLLYLMLFIFDKLVNDSLYTNLNSNAKLGWHSHISYKIVNCLNDHIIVHIWQDMTKCLTSNINFGELGHIKM